MLNLMRKILAKYRAFKSWYRNIYSHKMKININIGMEKINIPFFTKLKYNLMGFTDEEYYKFRLDVNNHRDYISYRERLRLENINGRFAFFLGEKVMFERFFGQFVNVPHIFCWIRKRKFIDLDSGSEISIINALRANKKLFAKPTRSYGGGGG